MRLVRFVRSLFAPRFLRAHAQFTTPTSQTTQACHAFFCFCSHTHVPSHLNATRIAFFLLRTLVRLFLCHLPRKMRLPRIFCVRLPHSQPTHAFFVCTSPPHSHLHFFMPHIFTPHTLFFFVPTR